MKAGDDQRRVYWTNRAGPQEEWDWQKLGSGGKRRQITFLNYFVTYRGKKGKNDFLVAKGRKVGREKEKKKREIKEEGISMIRRRIGS